MINEHDDFEATRQSFGSHPLCFIFCCYVFFELNLVQSLYMVSWGPGGSGAVNSQTKGSVVQYER